MKTTTIAVSILIGASVGVSAAGIQGRIPALEGAMTAAAELKAPQPQVTPWQALLSKVKATGVYSEDYASVIAPTIGIAHIEGPKEATHRANYVNLWGFKTSSGDFETMMVTFVSEDWNLDATNIWNIDQWSFRLRADGSKVDSNHYRLVEDYSGRVLAHEADRQRIDDPAGFAAKEQAKYEELLKRWADYKP